tara:strand:- start:25021 stop:25560 length:540 start_codon:yes stop_codon:yes gene_type:complete
MAMAMELIKPILDLILLPIVEPVVTIVEAVLKVISIVIVLITWIPELVKLAAEVLNPVKLVNDGITGFFLSFKILFSSIYDSVKDVISSPKYNKCKDNGSGLFGIKRPKDDKGKIIGTNGKKCVPPTLFRLIVMILCPPLGLFLHLGLKGWLHVLIATFLTVFCFYFPGLLYVVLHVLC